LLSFSAHTQRGVADTEWQHLVREQRIMADGRLPPIEPIVLYNGDARWRAAVDLAELIGLPTDSPMWR
jgi:hypothetical protein